MKQIQTLEEILLSKIVFHGVYNGWHKTYCESCGDGRRIKGPRGGWRFDDTRVFYHCFNCGVNANYDSNRDIPFSKEMRPILESFGITPKEYMSTISLKRTNTTGPTKLELKVNELDIPDYFMMIKDASLDNEVAIEARRFLRDKYDLTLGSYPFYMSTGITSGDIQSTIMAKSLINRIIVPYFRNDKLIYWQARALSPDAKKPYINADSPRSNVLFGIDKLFKTPELPLYVVEGAFDAINLDGVGTLENQLTSQQIDLLKKSPRKKIIVPDSKGDSHKLAEQALEHGWSISLPNMGDCKDVSETILKYGRMYLFHEISSNICEGRIAQMKLGIALRKRTKN